MLPGVCQEGQLSRVVDSTSNGGLGVCQELHPCGAETLYMDPAYLGEIVEGLMRVHVRHAIGLQPQGEKGECNPFVTVALGPGAGALPP